MSTEDEPLLTLVRYAEALAVLRGYAAEFHDVILANLGVSRQDLSDAAARWGAEVTQDLSQGDAAAILAFARAYGQVERRIRLYHPPVHKLKPDPALREFVRSPRRRRGARESGGTTDVMGSAPEQAGAPPPEHKPPVVVPSYLQVARSSEAHPAAAGGIDPDKTAMVDEASVQRGQRLPFEADTALTQLAQLAKLRAEYSAANPPVARVAAAEETKDVATPAGGQGRPAMAGTVALEDGVPTRPSTPFESRSGAAAVGLTLERYAQITVALGASTEREAVLRSFGLHEGTWTASARSWGEKIMGNPKLRAAFDEAVARARGRR